MGNNWKKISLSELLLSISRPEKIIADKEYNILGAHWYAQGLYTKVVKLGAAIRADKLYRVEEGDFVYNRLFAWKGSFALAAKENHNCYVSNEFPCYQIRRNLLEPQYLWRYFSLSSVWGTALGLSKGGTPTSRNRLKEENLLSIKIPLPPLSEQKHIISRVESLASKIEEARDIKSHALVEIGKLYSSALAAMMRQHDNAWKRETIQDVIVTMDAGWSPQCEGRSANGDEWGVLKTTSVQWCEFRPQENKALPRFLNPKPEFCVQQDDVLVTRAGPRKRVGVVAAVRKSESRLTISDKLIRLRPNKSKIEPRFLELSLASPFSQEHIVQRKTGLADAQVNISQGILRNTPITYPSLSEQRRIVAHLDNLNDNIRCVEKMQAETAAELDALLPSILDKAFKGDL